MVYKNKRVSVADVIGPAVALDRGPRWVLVRTLWEGHVETLRGGRQHEIDRVKAKWSAYAHARAQLGAKGRPPPAIEDACIGLSWHERRRLMRSLVWSDTQRVAPLLPTGRERQHLVDLADRLRASEELWHVGWEFLKRTEKRPGRRHG